MASFLANKLDVLVEAGETQPPPAVATVEVDTTTPADEGDVIVTVTAERGFGESIQVSGCGIAGTDLDAKVIASPANATEMTDALTVNATGTPPPAEPCVLTVETGGGVVRPLCTSDRADRYLGVDRRMSLAPPDRDRRRLPIARGPAMRQNGAGADPRERDGHR